MRLPGRRPRPAAAPSRGAPADGQRLLTAARHYGLAGALVALVTGIGALARMQLPELVMLYLLGVVIAAARFGRGPSLLAATLSILVFDFFFIPPYFTFTVSEDRHVLTFAIMLVVGLLTSGLTLRIRKQEREARASEERITTLYRLSRDLTSAVDAEQAARATTRHAAEICQGAAAVLASDGHGGLRTLARSGPELSLDEAQRAAIERALAQAPRGAAPAALGVDGAGGDADGSSGARLTWVPLLSGAEVSGVLAFAPRGPALALEQRDFLDAFARLAALALERARLAKQAEAAAVRAQTEETRSSLLSAVSHDLRTPLAVITGAATTLRDEGAAVDDAQRADLLDTICEEAERLERLVRNLLDLTRLESGALEVKREWIPLEEIVGSALMRLEARLEGRPIHTDLPADLPLIPVDAVLVEQALVNLVENAAKYTPAGSAIEVAARASEQAVSVDVADRGPGLPPGDEARIFDKFFRGRGAGAAGAGLGLAICRGVAHAHGGTLVASNRAGGGALFRLTLPLIGKPPAAPPDLEGALDPVESPPS